MISIRELTIDDLEGLIRLLQQLWLDKNIESDAIKEIIKKGLRNKYQIYVCAIDDDKIIGYCSLTIKNNLWITANSGNVDEWIVDQEYRNRGIGKQLLKKIEKIAKLNKCKRLELDSAFYRTTAHEFYNKLGFEKRAYLFTKEI